MIWSEGPEFRLARPGPHFLAAQNHKESKLGDQNSECKPACKKKATDIQCLTSFTTKHFQSFCCIPFAGLCIWTRKFLWLGTGWRVQQRRNSKVKDLVPPFKGDTPQSSKDNEKRGLCDNLIDAEGRHSEHEKTLIGELRENSGGLCWLMMDQMWMGKRKAGSSKRLMECWWGLIALLYGVCW